ncbi:MAG: hypothetical protein QM779_06810 [Propionicimonas sp.]|uniref:hypothetical protein n=1 Tax=Propionicimonas sp. TaxID=1955623 RepID=UPI003D13B22C
MLATCSFGPLDAKLNLLRLESMSRWTPANATMINSSESGAIPQLASGVNFASIQRVITFTRPEEAVSAQANALTAADNDGWRLSQYFDQSASREKALPLGTHGVLYAVVDPDSPRRLLIILKAFD